MPKRKSGHGSPVRGETQAVERLVEMVAEVRRAGEAFDRKTDAMLGKLRAGVARAEKEFAKTERDLQGIEHDAAAASERAVLRYLSAEDAAARREKGTD